MGDALLADPRVLCEAADRLPQAVAWYLYGYVGGAYKWEIQSQYRTSDDRELVYRWAEKELRYFGYDRGAALALSDPEQVPVYLGASRFLAEIPPEQIVLIDSVSTEPQLVGP